MAASPHVWDQSTRKNSLLLGYAFGHYKNVPEREGDNRKIVFFSFFGLRIGLGIEISQSHPCQSYFLKSESLANQ